MTDAKAGYYQSELIDPSGGSINCIQPVVPDTLDIPQRLLAVQSAAGFFPTTRRELHEAMTLFDYAHKPAGAAGHLNEILLHQQKAQTHDPTAAVRSVVSEYAAYAKKARNDEAQQRTLREEMGDVSGNVLRSLGNAVVRAGLHTGIGQLVRFHDLRAIAHGSKDVPTGFSPLDGLGNKRSTGKKEPAADPYTILQPDAIVRSRIDDVLKTTRLWGGRLLVVAAQDDQANRRAFWTERLKESRSHLSARLIADAALENLSVRE